MSKFYTQLFLITLICGAILFISDVTGFTHIGLIGWIALAFFAILTTVLTNMSLRSAAKSDSRFVTGVMGGVGLRMMFCVLFVIIYWVTAKERNTFFIIYFFILYLFFTVFEIKFLLSKLRPDNKNGIESQTN
ncbi:MAG: hypothetical protein ACKVQB_11410 [Bacteroidia bacterium]